MPASGSGTSPAAKSRERSRGGGGRDGAPVVVVEVPVSELGEGHRAAGRQGSGPAQLLRRGSGFGTRQPALKAGEVASRIEGADDLAVLIRRGVDPHLRAGALQVGRHTFQF